MSLPGDDANCGACGRVCPKATSCLDGVCSCTANLCQAADGGSFCTDESSDPANCGGCGLACPSAEICQGSLCACNPPSEVCSLGDGGSACLDVTVNGMNCGGCGTVCGPTQACLAGTCGCPLGQRLCGQVCVDTNVDVGNCGGCGQVCASGLCSGGVCNCSDSDAGYLACGASCVNRQVDVKNCGTCGNDCTALGGTSATVSCVGGACKCDNGLQDLCPALPVACVDLTSNNSHCGTCGNDCTQQPQTNTCVNGQCACPLGSELCSGGVCENVASDPNNCGQCSNSCDATFAISASCHGGHCACLDTQTLCLNAPGGQPNPLSPTCACADTQTHPCTQPTLSFDANVYPMLAVTTAPLGCSAAGCHAGATPAGGLDFTTEASAWQGLVFGDGGRYGSCDGGGTGAVGSIPAQACPCTVRVLPGNALQSYLAQALSGTASVCGAGSAMPIDADGGYHPLGACEQQQIALWINQGAKRN